MRKSIGNTLVTMLARGPLITSNPIAKYQSIVDETAPVNVGPDVTPDRSEQYDSLRPLNKTGDDTAHGSY